MKNDIKLLCSILFATSKQKHLQLGIGNPPNVLWRAGKRMVIRKLYFRIILACLIHTIL